MESEKERVTMTDVDILVIRTARSFKFTISRGEEKIRQIDPDSKIRSVTVEYDVFYDFENSLGLGSTRREVPKLFGIEGKLSYRFVDMDGNEIPGVVSK